LEAPYEKLKLTSVLIDAIHWFGDRASPMMAVVDMSEDAAMLARMLWRFPCLVFEQGVL